MEKESPCHSGDFFYLSPSFLFQSHIYKNMHQPTNSFWHDLNVSLPYQQHVEQQLQAKGFLTENTIDRNNFPDYDLSITSNTTSKVYLIEHKHHEQAQACDRESGLRNFENQHARKQLGRARKKKPTRGTTRRLSKKMQ